MKLLTIILVALSVLFTGLACSSNETQETTATTEETAETIAADEQTEVPVADTIVPQEEDLSYLYLLTNETAGLFTVGASVEQIEDAAGQYPDMQLEHVEFMAEGMAYPAIELTFSDNGTVLLETVGNTVTRITVTSELFATDCGVGVGSTYAELSDNYTFDGLVWGDGGDPLAVVEDAGMSFLIESGDWWQAGEVNGEIPDDTEINTIILW